MPAINRALVSRVSFRKTPICLAVSALMMHGPAQSAPVLNDPAGTRNGGVTVGAATISQNGNVTTVNQTSGKAAINWWSFGTAPNETVNFVQPNSSSITLNRVIGNEKSVLQGALNANGQVFLINSNGVLITKGATVNAAGFVASTLNLSDENFKKGKNTFKSTGSTASVINEGKITVTEGGYVALLGSIVSNKGTITATKGTVALNSGNKITLNFNGDSLLSVSLDEGTLNALVENKGAIYANGGQVIMTAQAANDLLSAQVNNTGIVQAQTIDDLKGSIEIYAHGGIANIDGTLDASAPTSGDGGFIETSGDRVKIADTAKILTKSKNGKNGKWLIDPVDFTIAASGGDITGTALSNLLGNSDITIETADAAVADATHLKGAKNGNGDINVNDAVTWSADTTLTLNAVRDVNVNKSITAIGANAGLTLTGARDVNINAPVTLSGRYASYAMNFGRDYNIRSKASYSGTVLDANGMPVAKQDTSGGVYGSITLSGDDATLTMNGIAYTLIHSMADLEAIAPVVRDVNGQPVYVLDQHGDPVIDANFNPVYVRNSASGNYAIAQDLDASGKTYSSSVIDTLGGTLAGLGHSINNLTIVTPDLNFYGSDIYSAFSQKVGLISQTSSVSPLTIRDIGIVNANISGGSSVGALLGYSDSSNLTIKNAYSTGNVTVYDSNGGGLVGQTAGANTSISNVFSSVNLTTGGTLGGLIGTAINTNISNAHATGNVDSDYDSIGGLVGDMSASNVGYSYATGTISSRGAAVGGLIGSITPLDTFPAPSSVSYSFATGGIGGVTGGNNVGGLIGSAGDRTNGNSITTGIAHSYATANVKATSISTRGVEGPGAFAGGLLGQGLYVNIDNSYATGEVRSSFAGSGGRTLVYYLGGLIGKMTKGSISNSHATGAVYASTAPGIKTQYIGGLVGSFAGSTTDLRGGSIVNSYATGDVNGTTTSSYVGGLVGDNSGTISGSKASGNVTGGTNVGGIAGANNFSWDGQPGTQISGVITDSKATGQVSGVTNVGGVAGFNAGNIANSTAEGKISGKTNVAGIAGLIGGSSSIVNSYWNTDTTGQANGIGGSQGGNPIVKNVKGLNQAQWRFLDFYLNGDLGAILGQGQLPAEAIQQASEVIQTAQRHSTSTEVPSSFSNRGPSIDSQITFADSQNFSAGVKSITVDGVRFDLEDENKSDNKN